MKHWLIIPLLAASCLPLTAQEGKKSPEVEFRVTRFDPADGAPPTFEVGSEAKRTEVEVPLTFIAGPFKAPLRDGRFLDFWRGEGETPEISLPITEAERKDLLLFFIPKDDSFRIIKVRTPAGAIRGGDRYLINACQSQIAIKAGNNEPLYLDPGKGDIVRAPRGDGVAMPVLVSIKEADAWKLATSETWYADPRFRKYLFAYPCPRTGQLRFHAVQERL